MYLSVAAAGHPFEPAKEGFDWTQEPGDHRDITILPTLSHAAQPTAINN